MLYINNIVTMFKQLLFLISDTSSRVTDSYIKSQIKIKWEHCFHIKAIFAIYEKSLINTKTPLLHLLYLFFTYL